MSGSREIIEFAGPPGSSERPLRAEVAVRGPVPVAGNRWVFPLPEFAEEVGAVVRSVVESVRKSLPELHGPAKVGIDFGVTLSVETSAVFAMLARASGEANIVVHFEWDRAAIGGE